MKVRDGGAPMKRLILSCACAVSILGASRNVQAQWAVVDATNLIQTTATAIHTAQTLENMIQQVNLMRQTLQSINPTSFSGLQNLLGQGQMTYQTLRNDINALGFALGDVNSGFDRLFPKDKRAWGNARYSDYDGYYTGWNTEITASAKFAERAQSTVLLVEKNNKSIADILSQSSTANGEVRQLQLINQQLALIHARLGDLVQNIATMGRISSNMAASSAGEKLLLREAKLRRRDGYTSRGQPARTLNRLP
jgi:P-type conjugative transfer protein TrbJ